MKNLYSRLRASRVALALLAFVAVAPMVASFHASVVQKSITVGNTKEEILNDASRVRQVRREFWRAVDVYKRLVQEGALNLAPPELNDPASIEFYLDLENGVTLRGAAPEDIPTLSDAQSTYNELPEWERDRIDGYVSTGICPGRLKVYHIVGYYELCVELLNERTENFRPQVDLSVVERQSIRTFNGTPIQTLRMRLKLLDESLSAPRTHTTGRPRITTK